MQELRDANGLTEAEFLAQYDVTRFERPSVTVDIILIKDGNVLLIRRGGHPCLGKLAFPGGFLEMNEDVYQGAARELYEETGLTAVNLKQLNVASTPNRDPRTRIITVPFIAEVADYDAVNAGDDAVSAKWYPFSYKQTTLNGVTFFEINIVDEGNRLTFKVSKSYDKKGLRADPIYKQISNSALAGDHAEIFAAALDNLNK